MKTVACLLLLAVSCEYPHPPNFEKATGIGCTLRKATYISMWYVSVWATYKGQARRWERALEAQLSLAAATEACEAWMNHVKSVTHTEK